MLAWIWLCWHYLTVTPANNFLNLKQFSDLFFLLRTAGADVTIKDNEGKTPLDILPALEQIAKERRKLLLREEKLSLIDKPVIMIDTNNRQNNALVKAFNIDKLHTYVEPNNDDDDENGFL
jgi:hypothetical protein